MSQPISGRCLCGAVTVTIDNFNGEVGICHCGMCRRWSGGPSFSINGKTLKLAGDEHVRVYDSSPWAERAFCSRCGSGLFYRLKKTGDRFVWAGLFGDLPGAHLSHQLYIDHKPGWYDFANQTPTMTEAEVIAKFTSGG